MEVNSRHKSHRKMRFLERSVSKDEKLCEDKLSLYSNDSVRELDDGFFEYFSSFEASDLTSPANTDDVVDYPVGYKPKYEGRRRSTLSESLLQSFTKLEAQDKSFVSQKERELLYVELLYTIQYKIGSESQGKQAPIAAEDLFDYGKRAFEVNELQHERLLTVTNSAKPPMILLNVNIVEARNLEAKDADGFSDPYCMLGIIPGSRVSEMQAEEESPKEHKDIIRKFSASLRGSFKRSSHKEKSQPDVPAKFIQSTKVIPNTLNPVWNEKYKFELEDVTKDKLHIDVWDHDDEESVFDAAKTLNHAKSMKGLGRVFKQIAQSARASTGDNVDDFLGCIDIPLHDIPSTGHSEWYDLCGRSSKSKVQGQIKVDLFLSTREDHGFHIDDNFNDIQQHQDLLKIFIAYEQNQYGGLISDWRGELSQEAETILHQHAIQGDITPTQKCFCRWIAYSSRYLTHQIHPSCLLEILNDLEANWVKSKLSGEEEAQLSKSFQQFLDNFFKLMEHIRSVFPATSAKSLAHLETLLECTKLLTNSLIYHHCCLKHREINKELSQSLKNGSKNYFSSIMATTCSASQKEIQDKIEEIKALLKVIGADLNHAITIYSPLFERTLFFPYFDPNYKAIERKLSVEVRQLLDEDLSSCLLIPTEEQNNQDAERNKEGQPNKNSNGATRNLLISSVLSLYFQVQSFADARKYLKICDGDSLLIAKYQDWFSRAIQEWLTLSKMKLEARIEHSVQQDKFVNIEDNFECSTSAVDVVNCYNQISEFWRKVRWCNEEELFAFSLKLADDICQSVVLYADLLHQKMRKTAYFDDEGQFDVQRPLCSCLNDLEYIRRTIKDLPERLQLADVIQAIEKHHNVTSGSPTQPTHFDLVFQSLIETAQSRMETKIAYIAGKVSDRMRPDIKKNIFHLCWSPEQKAVEEAIEPLINYLDQNLLTLYKYLLRQNFKIILRAIWRECLEELQEIVKENEEMSLNKLFGRIKLSMEILVDFFKADGKGLIQTEIETDLYKKVTVFLEVQQNTTEEIITDFYRDMITLQEECENSQNHTKKDLGILGFKSYYLKAKETLVVEVNYCKNIIALDSNGFSDPFVVWDLSPRHLFQNYPEIKTTIKRKTLNPIYDEVFSCKIPIEQLRQDGACLHFTLMDYNFVVKDDFGGEAYFPMTKVAGVWPGSPSEQSHARPAQLHFISPQTTAENPRLQALSKRLKDNMAQQFANNRLLLAREAQCKVNNNDSNH